jgi:glycosyltransferase involved in cell wall biosynthesis
MDACREPTGVTRHALAQLEWLRGRSEIELRVVTGRLSDPDGLAYWEGLDGLVRRELPLRTRDVLRWWRFRPWPPIEWWTGEVDWVYCPAEFGVATRSGRRAVTSHDVLQTLRFEPPRKRERLARVFGEAELVFSVSDFNTQQLLNAFPCARGRVVRVPNAADDLFFEAPGDRELEEVYGDLGLDPGRPYLLSVASFQPRKNLERLIEAAGLLEEVVGGDLALVLVGGGSEESARPVREAVGRLGPRAIVRMPGYRQGVRLRAIYARATALVFPSLCESFGIPVVEAMAQGVPVVLADSTALPEIGGEAGWYFDPLEAGAIAQAIRRMLDDESERVRRVSLGRKIAGVYRWKTSNDLLLSALLSVRGV